MSDGLRAILDGRRFDVTQAEFDEWRALTLQLRSALVAAEPVLRAVANDCPVEVIRANLRGPASILMQTSAAIRAAS